MSSDIFLSFLDFMTFTELQKILEKKFGATRLADIAKELDVTPQVVSNWKARNQVPYKYLKALRAKIEDIDKSSKVLYGNQDGFTNSEPKTSTDDSFSEIQSIIRNISYFLKSFLQYKTIILSITFICSFTSCIFFQFYADPVYSAISKILPISSGGNNVSGNPLMAVAKNLGVQGGAQASGLSSALMFPEILKSRRLSRHLIDYEFSTKKYGDKLPLINILLGSKNDSTKWSDNQIKYAIYKAQKMITVSQEKKSPLLVLSVSTFEKQLSADISDAIIEILSKIVNKFKLSQVKEKKAYINNRMIQVKSDLVGSEENLKVFRERNRKIIKSPTLLLEQERLMREVQVQTQMYITLKTQYEMAQIEEVDRQNMLQILDPPEAPTMKDSPDVILNTVIAALLGLSFSLGSIHFKIWYEDNSLKIKSNQIMS